MEKGWGKFVGLCHQEESATKLDALLRLLLTPEEQEQLGRRILLIEGLLKGAKTQREIARDLKISIAKITRGSNNLKLIDQEMRAYLLEKLVK